MSTAFNFCKIRSYFDQERTFVGDINNLVMPSLRVGQNCIRIGSFVLIIFLRKFFSKGKYSIQ